MKPYIHAVSSAKKFGGHLTDYLPIHDFMDSSKSVVPDVRHRAIFHSAFGIYIVEQMFGTTLKNSDGKEICVRDVAEQHVLEDLGFIPTMQDWLSKMPIEDWMISQSVKNNKNLEQKENLYIDESIENIDDKIDDKKIDIDDLIKKIPKVNPKRIHEPYIPSDDTWPPVRELIIKD